MNIIKIIKIVLLYKVQFIVLAIGLGLFIWGIIIGDLTKVMQIGTFICLGCIGIG